MSTVNIMGTVVSQASYKKAREIASNKNNASNKSNAPNKSNPSNKEEDTKITRSSMLESIRQMMSGWNVGLIGDRFSGNGMRNLEIAPDVLDRMVEDPEEMVRFKALILDLENVVQELEEKVADNPSMKEMILKIIVDSDGATRAVGRARSQDGVERRREFDLSDQDLPSWAELMRKHLADLRERNAEEDGTRSWYG